MSLFLYATVAVFTMHNTARAQC